MIRAAFASVLALALAGPAHAWSKAGHMVTGAIAYQVLQKENPKALKRVVEVLRAHPQFARLWKPKLAALKAVDPTADENLYLFMLAARWADDIRGEAEYDRPAWHYINYPVVFPGSRARAKPPDPKANLVKAFAENAVKAKAGPEDVDRAVPVCWLFHLVGDVHMPLHSVALFSETFPLGDRGGTRFYVKVTPSGEPINLHYFWDGLITNSEQFRAARNVATELRLRPEFAPAKLPELARADFEEWARVEGVALAKLAVYRDGQLKGGPTPERAEVLPADYPKSAKPVAERQAVLAGRRLAAVLAVLFGG